ncbi:MAG: serine hydrolase [Pseudomonadota bacterium]
MKHLSWFFFALFTAFSYAEPFERPAGVADGEEPLIATGYRALFTCSAHFVAGRDSQTDIENVELVDTKVHGFPQPEIDADKGLVVARSTKGHEMVAMYRDTMGCTLLPPNWSAGDAARLPTISYPKRAVSSTEDFPYGDNIQLPRSGIHRSFRALSPVIDKAFDGESYTAGSVTVGVLILQNGRPIVERYRSGFGPHSGYRTWSTAKSISSMVIGVAVKEGHLALDAPAPVPQWQEGDDPRQAITLRHLLHMSSGLYSGGNNTNAIYFGGQDVISAAATTHLEAEPGSRWKYANNDTLLALLALRAQLGNDLEYLHYPYDRLLHKIGMLNTRMEVDHVGNFIGSSQVYTTARDLGRFGAFLHNKGRWRDEQIVPESWIEFITTPAPARVTEEGDWNYGGQFWLMDNIKGVPADAYTTAGNKGQYVTVVPSLGLVVVRTGVNPNGVRWDHNGFMADVIGSIQAR